MYNAQETKQRIKLLCKTKKVNMENLNIECGLGVNAIRQINDKKGMASYSLARIADYLNCSVDYLLGRTEAINVEDNLKVALFGDTNVTDEMLEEVVKYARYVKERHAKISK